MAYYLFTENTYEMVCNDVLEEMPDTSEDFWDDNNDEKIIDAFSYHGKSFAVLIRYFGNIVNQKYYDYKQDTSETLEHVPQQLYVCTFLKKIVTDSISI